MPDLQSQSRDAELRRLLNALQHAPDTAALPDVVRYLSDELERQASTDQRIEELFRSAETARHEIHESREQNRAKDRFLAVLSHELRTPLQPVLAAASALFRDGRLPPDLLEQVRTIQRNVQLEARLIDDLLDLTKITTGKLALEKLPVNIQSVIPRIVEICEGDVMAKRQTLSLSLRATRTWVTGDPGRLHQVLWNLVKNAVKFTGDQGEITVHTLDGPEGRLIIEVVDNGMGIDASVLPRIFDAFEQGDPSITQQFGGLGLGLAISKVLAESHAGTLEAFSDGRGRGATFRLSLPTIDSPQSPPAAARSAYNPTPSRVLRILLVEDDLDTLHVMEKLLASLRHHVITARTCEEALTTGESSEIDLLICDLGLPDGNGLDIVGPLKALAPEAKAIALTGYGSPDDVQRSVEAGFDAHLTKPVTLDQIVQAINRLFA
jgi:two-component system CheB/CheR fusion protein